MAFRLCLASELRPKLRRSEASPPASGPPTPTPAPRMSIPRISTSFLKGSSVALPCPFALKKVVTWNNGPHATAQNRTNAMQKREACTARGEIAVLVADARFVGRGTEHTMKLTEKRRRRQEEGRGPGGAAERRIGGAAGLRLLSARPETFSCAMELPAGFQGLQTGSPPGFRPFPVFPPLPSPAARKSRLPLAHKSSLRASGFCQGDFDRRPPELRLRKSEKNFLRTCTALLRDPCSLTAFRS